MTCLLIVIIFIRKLFLEYKLIESLNSYESYRNEEFFKFDKTTEVKNNFKQLLVNLDNFKLNLPSKQIKSFLKEKWTDSVTNVRENIQQGNFQVIEDIEDAKLKLAVLIFDMNLNLSDDEAEERSKLLELLSSVIKVKP